MKNKKTKNTKQTSNPFRSAKTDPTGSWTGICTDSPYEIPPQDADDL